MLIRSIVRTILPISLRKKIVFWGYVGQNIHYLFGVFSRSCNICGYEGKFQAFGYPPRLDAMCPSCNSLERHRLLSLRISKQDIEFQEPILHFAPEKILESEWRVKYLDYKSADISYSADLKLNVEAIDQPSDTYGTVVCSHVLEHVDDSAALRELYRILRPGGIAILMVPIIEGWESTFENPEFKSERERLLHFGQKDHIRFFAKDFRSRIEAAGFSLSEYFASPDECAKYSLIRGERIFICKKDGD